MVKGKEGKGNLIQKNEVKLGESLTQSIYIIKFYTFVTYKLCLVFLTSDTKGIQLREHHFLQDRNQARTRVFLVCKGEIWPVGPQRTGILKI